MPLINEQLLTAYALDELSPDDKAKVEAYLSVHPEAAVAVEAIRMTAKQLGDELMTELQDAPAVHIRRPTPVRRNWAMPVALAASVALVAGTYVALIGSIARPTNPAVAINGVTVDGLRKQATDLTRSQKYAEALTVIDQILAVDPMNDYANGARQLVVDKANIHEARAFRNTGDYQFSKQLNRAEEAKIPHDDILRYPADWQDLSSRNGQITSTEGEKANYKPSSTAGTLTLKTPGQSEDETVSISGGMIGVGKGSEKGKAFGVGGAGDGSGVIAPFGTPGQGAAGPRPGDRFIRGATAPEPGKPTHAADSVLDIPAINRPGTVDTTAVTPGATPKPTIVVRTESEQKQFPALSGRAVTKVYDIRDLIIDVPDFTDAPSFNLTSTTTVPPKAVQPDVSVAAGARVPADEGRKVEQLSAKAVPLGAVLQQVAAKTHSKMEVDWERLQAVGITPDSPVTVQLRNFPADAVVRNVLNAAGENGQGLKFARRGDVYVISTEDGWRQFNTESYERIYDNPFLDVAAAPLSTFSIDVDTASYSNVRRFLTQGQLPPKDAVRIEEMVNYFPYAYEGPGDRDKPFAASVEIAACPWNAQNRLVRVGIKGREMPADQRPASNLVFLIDVSGSMSDTNKLPLVKQSLRELVNKLDARDRVAIVVYAGSTGLVLPSTAVGGEGETNFSKLWQRKYEPMIVRDEEGKSQNEEAVRKAYAEEIITLRDAQKHQSSILKAIDNLQSGGSTNGGAGIELAYSTAQSAFIKDGVNRVILATDGDFNVGITDRGALTKLIEEKAKGGVFLSVLGFGMGNTKDATMESLADKGNGNYAYIDNLAEAKKVLVDQMSGTLVTIAKDVKIQVEFNPSKVAGYRLIGYENRLLAKEDFNNDKKDAGEIGAGHTVTALYEVVPAGLPLDADQIVRLTLKLAELKQHRDARAKLLAQPDAQSKAIDEEIAEIEAALRALDRKSPAVDPLKYQAPVTTRPASPEMLTLKLRYKAPDAPLEQGTSKLLEFPITDAGKGYAQASGDFKFAAAVAGFGMILRDSPHKGSATYASILELAGEGKGADANGYRAEFLQLVECAKAISGK